jgi:hypothetical protein
MKQRKNSNVSTCLSDARSDIADLRTLRDHCVVLGADLVVIGAIAYQVHFPAEARHTGDIDFAVAPVWSCQLRPPVWGCLSRCPFFQETKVVTFLCNLAYTAYSPTSARAGSEEEGGNQTARFPRKDASRLVLGDLAGSDEMRIYIKI